MNPSLVTIFTSAGSTLSARGHTCCLWLQIGFRLYRLCRNDHCCTPIAVQVGQKWRNSGHWASGCFQRLRLNHVYLDAWAHGCGQDYFLDILPLGTGWFDFEDSFHQSRQILQ
jgi:hypothetical protein